SSTRYRHLGITGLKSPLPLDMEPMLSAISDTGIPKGDSWEYEPKWDGFRTLVYRDGDDVALMSRGGRPMTRYFPELLPAFRGLAQSRLVLDGEVIVVGANGLDFGALQQRVHPAESRVRMLSEATPAWFVAFDLLAEGAADLRQEPPGERRKRLEKLLKGVKKPIFLTPYTRDPKKADEWFEKFEGAGLDGVMANPGRMPGGVSRWSRGKGKDAEWVAVRPELVCEVTYDKLEAGERFRHATGFLRWRTDKPPKKCGFDQIASAAQFDVRGIFRSN